MKKAKSLKKFTNLIAVIVILLGVIPFTAAANITTVYADDGDETTEPAAPAAEEAPEAEETAPAEDAEAEGDETIPVEATETEGEVAEEAPDAEETTPADDVETEEEVMPEAVETVEEELAEGEADVNVSEIVEVLSEAQVQIVDESGEALPLASVEAVEVLANSDPFFWDGSEWVGYTVSGTGCPANVTCIQNDFPFQEAVNQAGQGNMIYVASGTYDEDVVVGTGSEDLSFTAFHAITVPYADQEAGVTVNSSGYALLNSITLNVNFGTTLGVYADEVIVNEFGTGNIGGQLEDGLALVNDGGTVEADVVFKGGGGYYIIQDAHDSSGTEYEWECGEPDVHIYQKGWSGHSGEYRMVLMQPMHLDIVDYYNSIYSPDERVDIPNYLTGTPLDAELRLEDLVIGVNVSERDNWDQGNTDHTSEQLIYWNLLGNIGKDSNNIDMSLNTIQQDLANSITDGTNDTIKRDQAIWFLWPIFEYTSNTRVNAYPIQPTEDGQYIPARQLTFIQLPTSQVYGCMDPEAENYDPNATEDNEDCVYPENPPSTTVGAAFVPGVGGLDLITAGIGHTCALTAKEGLECWGLNEFGQVGDSSFDDTLVPVDVVGIDPGGVIGLVSGIHHTCVLTSANEVFCWGLNGSGQLGDGTTENRNEPILVDGIEGKITSISAGAEFTCALNDANDVFCWGNNSSGQLNDGTEIYSSLPVKTTTVSDDTVLISGGSEELQGLTSDGVMQLWNSQPIIPVTGLPDEDNAYVSADRFTEGGCTMTDAGDVNCWGGITDAQVKGAVVNDMLSSGQEHACTMKAEGLVCWGSNSNGQLGDDSLDDSLEETLVIKLEQGVIALAAGMKHTCVIYADETIACWGLNDYGQLGNDTIDDSMVPVNTK